MGISILTPAVRITLITAVVTALLAALKLTTGFYGQSHALFADGIHSIADVLVDILVLFAAHYGNQKADHNHPYGHGRIETAGTFGLALMLLLAGAGIIINAGEHIWTHLPAPVPDRYVLWTAIAAIFLNEGLFRVTMILAEKINSPLLKANAWHSRSDAAVSVIVLLGIGGALIGFTYLDVICAIFVGIMIGKMGLTLAWKSISELVDTGVDASTLEKIKTAISAVEGVSALHLLRTRTINNQIFIDVHILVSPRISVSEGHFIGDQVILTLQKLPDIRDITVHIDPEDDEILHLSSQLPSRQVIMSLLKAECQYHKLDFPKDIQLHYLYGKIEIVLFVSHSAEKYALLLKKLEDISQISVVIAA